MATTRSLLVLDTAGAPLTAGAPVFLDYRDRSSGAPRTAPAVPVHVGGGVWNFTPSDADESIGTVALIDFGASASPRYATASIFLPNRSNQFWGLHVTDGAGALWTGAAPTIGLYDDWVGTPRTAPAVLAVSGARLFVVAPSAADAAIGVAGRIDGPAGSAQPFWHVTSGPVVSGGASVSPAPVYNPQVFTSAPETALPRFRDLAFDHKTSRFFQVAGDLVLTRDLDAIRQAVNVHLLLFRGEWFLDTSAGVPWFDRILVKSPNLKAIEAVFRSEIESVSGVTRVTAIDLTFDRSSRRLRVNWSASTDLGEIAGEVSPALPGA